MAEAELYVPRPHVVRPHDVLTGVFGENLQRGVRVKSYTMIPIGEEDFSFEERTAANNHLLNKIFRGSIYGGLGLGFSILSDGVMNVCMWGGKYPSLLNQAVYSFKRENMLKDDPDFKPESLAESGTFCCWELGVAGHEGTAWRRYLLSPQSGQDREAYLADRFNGVVGGTPASFS